MLWSLKKCADEVSFVGCFLLCLLDKYKEHISMAKAFIAAMRHDSNHKI
jgi:hypothetical protein